MQLTTGHKIGCNSSKNSLYELVAATKVGTDIESKRVIGGLVTSFALIVCEHLKGF